MGEPMTKRELINSLFAILGLYEDIFKPNKEVTEKDYLAYLRRKYVQFVGRGETEIADLLKGLEKLGCEVSHEVLKSIVFHMIGLVTKGGN